MFDKIVNRIGSIPPTSNPAGALIGGLIGLAICGHIDWLTGPELALSFLYLFPVGICSWIGGRRVGMALAVLSAVVWTLLDINNGRPYSNHLIPYWNGGVRLAIFSLISLMLSIIRDLTL